MTSHKESTNDLPKGHPAATTGRGMEARLGGGPPAAPLGDTELPAWRRCTGLGSVSLRVAGVLQQIWLLAGAALAYFGVRALTKSDRSLAIAHAVAIVAFERRLHIQIEGSLQGLVINRQAIVTAANWYYIFGHWPVILASFVWLYISHRDTYRHLRNAMFISGAIGLVIFWRCPVAPPRLADIGLVDTVTLYSHAYRVLQPRN